MMIELEKTFLAKHLPKELAGQKPQRVTDIYFPNDPAVKHPNLRLRQQAGKLNMTKKKPIDETDSSRQLELTIPLTLAEFSELSKASQRRVVKDRFEVKIGSYSAEVDVFQEKLAGLVLIDFEFTTEAAKAKFKPPACCLAEVTQEEFIAGGLLAGKSYHDIKPQLDRFGYQKL